MAMSTALIGLTLVLSLAVLAAIAKAGLLRRFQWFGFLLAQAFVFQSITLVMTLRHPAYRWVFLVGTLVSTLASVLAVLELAGNTFRDFAGLASTSQWIIRAAAAGAMLFGIASTMGNPVAAKTNYHFWFTLTLIMQKGTMVSLALFLLIVLGFLAILHARLPRLVIRYASLLCTFFLTKTFAILYFEWAGRAATDFVRDGLLGLQVACLAGWVLVFLSANENSAVPVNSAEISPETEGVLIQRVTAANAALDRLYRR